jgi:hypothetical protein
MTTKTKGQLFAADIAALLRARNPLIWVVTREEARAEALLFEAARSAGYMLRTWDVGQGAANFDGSPTMGGAELRDPGDMMGAIRGRTEAGERDVWVMRDLPVWLQGPQGATTMRQVRNLTRLLPTVARASAQAMVILSPDGTVPAELAGHATVVELPLPDRAEIAAILDSAIESLPEELKANAAPNGARNAAIDAAVGLSGEEAQACYARSLVQLRRIDPATVAGEKKRVIAREKVLEWYDPLPGGLEAVGGLEGLKGWLRARATAYSPQARSYGLPAPKGCMLVGVPGCGKSLTAKAVATAWGVPLLRLDLGALKGKYVGESEGNIRKAFRVIEALGRCVVWIDEVEKALQGATSGSADGGVSSDALGSFLSWMQERSGEAFVVATANDVSALPPELLRKGRFDEVFFVDLPTPEERAGVLAAALRSHGRGQPEDAAVAGIVRATENFTGAEIAAVVPEAMFQAFADGAREITARDMIEAAANTVPLAVTAKAKISALREWAKGKARPAGRPEAVDQGPKLRALDLG